MATHNRNELNSPLDDLIRDQLTREARRSEPPESDRTLMRLLQHAQTEVEQLPALVAEGGSTPETLPAQAQAVETTPVRRPTLLHRQPPTRIPQYSVADQIEAYRLMMDMKMWCTVGSLSASMSFSR